LIKLFLPSGYWRETWLSEKCPEFLSLEVAVPLPPSAICHFPPPLRRPFLQACPFLRGYCIKFFSNERNPIEVSFFFQTTPVPTDAFEFTRCSCRVNGSIFLIPFRCALGVPISSFFRAFFFLIPGPSRCFFFGQRQLVMVFSFCQAGYRLGSRCYKRRDL